MHAGNSIGGPAPSQANKISETLLSEFLSRVHSYAGQVNNIGSILGAQRDRILGSAPEKDTPKEVRPAGGPLVNQISDALRSLELEICRANELALTLSKVG